MNLVTHDLAHYASVLTQRKQFRKKTKSLNDLSLAVPKIHGLVTQDYLVQDREEMLLRAGASAPAFLFENNGKKLAQPWRHFLKVYIYRTMRPIYTRSSQSGGFIQNSCLQPELAHWEGHPRR